MPRKKLTSTQAPEESPQPTAPQPELEVPKKPKESKPKSKSPKGQNVPVVSQSKAKKERATPVPVLDLAESVSEPSATKQARLRPKKETSSPFAGDQGRVAGEALTPATPTTPSQPAPAVPSAKQGRSRSRSSSGKGSKSVGASVQAQVPAVAQTSPMPAGEPMNQLGSPRRRSKERKEAPAVSAQAQIAAPAPDFGALVAAWAIELGVDDGLPVPYWRAKGDSQRRSDSPTGAAPASDEVESAHPRARRSRNRGRGERKPQTAGVESELAPDVPAEDTPVAAPNAQPTQPRPKFRPRSAQKSETPKSEAILQEVAPPELTKPKQPEAVQKPLIEIPEDAPQVVNRGGIPTLVRDHRVFPPLFFFGNPADERRAATVLDELRMAADSGVHLHAYLIDLDVDLAAVDQAVSFAAYILAQSVRVDPESQVLFRIVFHAARGWQDKFPNGRYRADDGSTAEPSVCDDEFWGLARQCLEQFVLKMRLLDLRDHILGVHLDRGEWFLAEHIGYDTSRAAQGKFRDWARGRYLNDEVTLRASWFDGGASFDGIQIPRYEPEGTEGEKFIRASRKQRKYVDYHLFLSDATVHRIGELAYAAKSASQGYFLVGASYGYTFEWSHPSSGHLSLGKLLRTPEIDFIAGPPSYRTREPGGASPFPGPIDSFALNGKLYLSEEDFKTSLSTRDEPDDFNPPLRTPQALESVHWRGAGAALAHAGGMAWMDLWGNGWLQTPSVWQRAARVQSALIDRMDAPLSDPDVAVFIDERALAYLVDPKAFHLLVQNVRESVLRAGVSAGFYLLSDLAHREKFPESKLYIFLNAWDVRPDLRAAIKSRLQRDNKVLFWLYSAGLFDAGRDSLERAREVTGIALKPQPFYSKSGTTILNRRNPLSEAFPDRNVIGGMQLEPSYFAIPEGATVLGEYTQTGLPSFVVKEVRDGAPETHWTSVFLGEPVVNPALIRALSQMAGVHIWSFQDDVVHARTPFLTIHCTGGGSRTVALPSKTAAYDLINNEWTGDSHNVRMNVVDGSTHVLLVAPREDVEHMLSLDPNRVLRIDQLPPRESNVREDVSNFDVPLMRLDEWMEGGEEVSADEWFLRPQQIIEEPEQAQETDSVGKRRRRRRGRSDRNGGSYSDSPGSGPAQPPTTDFDDLDMNVMFRKRE